MKMPETYLQQAFLFFHQRRSLGSGEPPIEGAAPPPRRCISNGGPTRRTSSYPPYILITPARNEEAFIEKTIESMIHQTVLPLRWVIVDDGSTDRTAEIVEIYAKRYPWIELARRPPRKDRNFAAKVYAFNDGFERIRTLQFELVGNLDADISFGPDHFEFLISKFAEDPALGVAGTAYTQEGWDSTQDSF